MQYYVIRAIESLVTPPGLMFVMIFTGFLVGSHFARLGRNLILTGLFLLLAASLPISSLLVYTALESDPPLNQAVLEKTEARAIVILGAGRYPGHEYGKDTVSASALERLRYGSWLHKQTGLPILVTGGSVRGEVTPEAQLMAQALTAAFGVQPEWIEGKGRNTWENGRFSRQLLQKQQISHILLVTHAAHMWRAKAVFIRQGFTVTAAPLGFQSRSTLELLDLLPAAHALAQLQRACHELIGRLWYLLRY